MPDTKTQAPDSKSPDLESGFDLEHIPNGRMVPGCWRGKPVIVVNQQGRYCAVSAECTHMGAPLNEGTLVDGELHCPWHHARFSLATGEAVGAPAFAPLTRFGTVVRDGRLFLSETPPSPAGTLDPAAANPAGAVDALRAQPAPGAALPEPRVLILGGGAAGHACAQWLMRSGFCGTTTVVSDDADAPYDRTVCSKQYLIGMQSRAESALDPLPSAPSDSDDAVIRVGCTARAIDVRDKSVQLEGGERVKFDVLVLATGAEPKRPQWPGAELPNVHVLRTLRDADALIGASQKAKRVVVIGASFIGLEAAASLRQRHLEVQVVSPEDVPLKKLLGEDVGRMIQAVHEEKGVQFHLGREVRRFDGEHVLLDDGSTLAADFVVLGVGVTPRTDIAVAAGIDCASAEAGGGVLVDERLESSVPGIFAVGDIARYPDPHSGKRIRVEHWVHAQRQGQHVARVIMDEARRLEGGRYTDVPFFWSAHFDTGLRYIGHVDAIADMLTDGSVGARDFSRHYAGPAGEKAFVTCNRDQESLREESAWDRAL